MQKKILVPIADGTEMIEALSVVDIFRRAGAHVDLASVGNKVTTSSHEVRIEADKLIEECLDEEYDLVVIPGGIPGSENLKNSSALTTILKKQYEANKLYGAICAAPAVVLGYHGLLEGKKATCHPLYLNEISGETVKDEKVVQDGNCVTSQGAGTAIDFSLALLARVMGTEKMKEVAKGLALNIS
ncbi:MAG: DJ-1 family protein [Proteobacteria bacterium]|nr:MAG: DJ-1 family protein [Pseudomonadota bacterium]PIE65162.1 MAG: DJ-1 family protein [Desulfobacterales bacterium]